MNEYYLPNCQNRIDPPGHMQKIEYTNHRDFLMTLRQLLSRNCIAFAVDSEIIWNEYIIIGLTYKQRLYQSMLRDYIIANPVSLINNFDPNELHILDIYIYNQTTTLYKVLALNGKYTFTFYN